MSVEAPLTFIPSRQPKPEWLKVRAPGSPNYLRLKGIMQDPHRYLNENLNRSQTGIHWTKNANSAYNSPIIAALSGLYAFMATIASRT